MKGITGINFIFVGIIATVSGAIILLKNDFATNHPENNSPAKQEIKVVAQNLPDANKSILDYSLIADKLTKQKDNLTTASEAEAKATFPKKRKMNRLANDSKKKGYDFEKYVIRKFDKKQFKLKVWDERNYLESISTETVRQPDLIYQYTQEGILDSFAVECKWRKQFQDNEIEIATHQQIENYKIFEKKTGLPVFITLGIGGEPASPKQIYIIPLNKIFSNKVDISFLMEFEQVPSRNFIYDSRTKNLSARTYPAISEGI
ncbi:hypothetical protein HUW51_03870 [Adhaeribacter swui]|uniref:Uncharacterized protein n=1 Tax=Adhaeribacter swui TaxID=2086471 RepID=A0A7G7G416_9BACT|nr:hypothetical protein [Adhaeribacter swui]QNF31900.1 hypothetical protein HUW51_03870 [Adhaeribacter swui]